MQWKKISEVEIQTALKSSNFWLKKIQSIHKTLAKSYTMIQSKTEISGWFVREETYPPWEIDLNLTTASTSMKLKDIEIKNEIYQRNSLSPLLFCLSLFPLSFLLNNSKSDYRVKKEIEKIPLTYINDLKIIAKNDEELSHQLEMVKKIRDDIQVDVGVGKCAKNSLSYENCTEVKI